MAKVSKIEKICEDKQNNRWIKMLSLMLAVCFLVCIIPSEVYARDLEDIQAEIDAKKAEMEALEADILANQNNRDAAEVALAEYQIQFDELAILIEEKDDVIGVTLTELDFKTEQLFVTMQSIEENKKQFEERLRAIYDMNSTNAMISTLLSVNSFAEFIQAADAMRRISENDTATLEQLALQQEELEVQKVELEALLSSLQAELAQLQVDRDWSRQKMDEMNSLIASANSEIAQGQDMVAATEEEIDALITEYERIFKQLQQSGSQAGDGSVRYSGSLVWPTGIAPSVSSWYGDPRSGGTRGHYGIDMPGPEGTPILAAASGVVITAEWHYSYGYYIVVDHGQGFRTLYAHNSQLYVGVGMSVTAGETIAGMGNTGNSYGSHLHFEVHEHGGRQDPAGANYLGILL